MAIRYCVSALAFFSLYISPVVSISYCGNGQMKVWGQHCYFFSYPRVSWIQAKTNCGFMDATLASVHSREEAAYISKGADAQGANYYWIGMRKDSSASGNREDYKWIDGTEVDFVSWESGQPDNRYDFVKAYYFDHDWKTYPSSTYLEYVCKAPIVNDWQPYNGNEYYISTLPEEIENTWYEARDFCMQQGGDVASILSEAEVTQVVEWATKTSYQGQLWIGLNKLADDRENWGWSDGSSFSSTWKNWESLFPNNDKYRNLCGYQISKDAKGKWMNAHCDTKKGFLCKRPITSSPIPKTTVPTQPVDGYCPAGYYGSGNKCFKVVLPGHFGDGSLTFEQAVDKCRKEPGRLPSLASIENEVDQAFINAHLTSVKFGAWIGLRRETFGSTWKWVDSSPRQFENWDDKKPDGSNGHCAEVRMLPGSIGKWNNIQCSDKRGYVCQTYKDTNNVISTPAVPKVNFTCPADFTPYWYGCYKYQPTAWSWDKASAECKKLDSSATLVGIHAEAENAAIQTLSLTNGTDIWLGFRDKTSTTGENGEYKWEDGWRILWTNWAGGQPVKEFQGGCVRMSSDGRWSDDVCSKQYASVCKISQIPAQTTPATLPGKCPTGDNWFKDAEHCYLLVPDGYSTWEQAKLKCHQKAFMSNLASIHSYHENKMLLDHLNQLGYGNKDMWIGLHRSQLDRTRMKWTDGTALQYEAWAPREPNGEESKEDCVKMWNENLPGMWDDHRCSVQYGYICKAPKTPHVSLPTSAPKCDPGWHHSLVTGHCYLFKPDDLLPFNVALKTCRDVGGSDLASIHHAYEMSEVRNGMDKASILPQGNTNKRYWFGMAINQTEEDKSVYYFTDGTEHDYDNWASDPPSNPDVKCVYASLTDGKWSTGQCDQHYGLVCKKPGKKEVPTSANPTSGKPTDGSGAAGVMVAGMPVFMVLISCLLGLMLRFSP